jgi:hypothetical protein
MMARTILLALVLAACGGGTTTNGTPDAMPAGPDAPMCTGAVYDQCTDPSQCTSGMCHLYNGSMFQVCTTSCSASNPCPDYNGVAVACNMMGNCKPPAARVCAR